MALVFGVLKRNSSTDRPQGPYVEVKLSHLEQVISEGTYERLQSTIQPFGIL